MNKKIKDVTFKEFAEWANRRAADGQWGLQTAAVCCELIADIYKQTRHIFFKRRREKKQEELFEYYKPFDFNMDAEIELD